MATYRLLEGHTSNSAGPSGDTPGYEFEWDGVTVDSDGDIAFTGATGFTQYVSPRYVELVLEKVSVKETTETVTKKIFTVQLSEEEARIVLRKISEEPFGGPHQDLYDDLYEALN